MKKRTLSGFAKNPRSGIGKFMVLSQLAIQVSLATAPFYAHSAVAAPDDNALKWYQSGNLTPEEQARYQQQTGHLASAAALLSEQDSTAAVSGMARSAATGALNNEVSGWLNQFGTARIQLNLDDKFTLNGSQADVLLPLYENDSALLFTQLGLRRLEQRTTGNLGLGARAFTGDWMFGVNTFYDNDFTGDNRRAGVGVEAWRDYLHLSGNSYFRLSNWHPSRDFADYDERPANGYDIRVEGWLPAYPQLGAKLMFEQYQGDEVALFGKDQRQKDPWAFTGGVSYTPIPLLTLGAEHRAGKNGQQDSQITLALSYRPGEPWHKQINPDNVGASRLLSGSRHDLVERNNSIVLDYRKQETLTLGLPENATGKGLGVLALSYTLKNTYPVQNISWASPALIAAGGIITPAGDGRIDISLPSWRGSNPNRYTLTGTV
ncbi:inverse autotransporter beta domain-containing protein, partial [Winslowiella iniecta]|uniref:inverse autotransporter beta domain-containing protein n=2 Tax=Winslowiella iniecta TaxID=1560201 RepID=UPI00156B0A1E